MNLEQFSFVRSLSRSSEWPQLLAVTGRVAVLYAGIALGGAIIWTLIRIASGGFLITLVAFHAGLIGGLIVGASFGLSLLYFTLPNFRRLFRTTVVILTDLSAIGSGFEILHTRRRITAADIVALATFMALCLGVIYLAKNLSTEQVWAALRFGFTAGILAMMAGAALFGVSMKRIGTDSEQSKRRRHAED